MSAGFGLVSGTMMLRSVSLWIQHESTRSTGLSVNTPGSRISTSEASGRLWQPKVFHKSSKVAVPISEQEAQTSLESH